MTPARLIAALCRNGPRTVGSPGHARAQELLRNELATIPGGRLEREVFTVEVDEELDAVVRIDGRDLPARRFAGTATANGSVEAAACWCGAGSSMRAAAGGIAVVRTGLIHHRIRQMEAAAAAGALGVVAVSGHRDEVEQGLGAVPGQPMPIPGLCLPGRFQPELRRCGKLQLSWTVRRRSHLAENLVLYLPGRGRPVVVCAHYDAWGGGAADNAAGVAVAIAAVRRFAQSQDRPALRLLLCDAEELGLHGSAHHLARHGGEGLRACVNLDQPVPGRGQALRTVFLGARLWAGRAPLLCLRHGFVPLSLDWIYRVLGDLFPSDVHHFHRLGIPSATSFCGGPRHRDGDTPAGLEPAGLERAIALATALIHAAA